jgi:hypothetical protein
MVDNINDIASLFGVSIKNSDITKPEDVKANVGSNNDLTKFL